MFWNKFTAEPAIMEQLADALGRPKNELQLLKVACKFTVACVEALLDNKKTTYAQMDRLSEISDRIYRMNMDGEFSELTQSTMLGAWRVATEVVSKYRNLVAA